jgi:hypothetical protein
LAQFLRNGVFRGTTPISYHIFSSIWSSIKHKLHWPLVWCFNLLISLNICIIFSKQINVKSFIENAKWKFPSFLLSAYPNLQKYLKKMTNSRRCFFLHFSFWSKLKMGKDYLQCFYSSFKIYDHLEMLTIEITNWWKSLQ